MKTTEASRRRLRSIAHRLTREGDVRTMSGAFGQYNEGDAVKAALDDLGACLALLQSTEEAFSSGRPLPIVRIRALLAEASR